MTEPIRAGKAITGAHYPRRDRDSNDRRREQSRRDIPFAPRATMAPQEFVHVAPASAEKEKPAAPKETPPRAPSDTGSVATAEVKAETAPPLPEEMLRRHFIERADNLSRRNQHLLASIPAFAMLFGVFKACATPSIGAAIFLASTTLLIALLKAEQRKCKITGHSSAPEILARRARKFIERHPDGKYFARYTRRAALEICAPVFLVRNYLMPHPAPASQRGPR